MSQVNDENQPRIKSILIVEDDIHIGQFLELALNEETPCHVLHAVDAFQALECIQTLIPDLLLVDYQLPRMNGLELYDHLQEQEAFRSIPVLFMSANLSTKELEKRHAHLIKKPFELDELLQAVNTLLGDA